MLTRGRLDVDRNAGKP